VLPAIRAFDPHAAIGERVVIIGGGGIGAEIAPYLARRWTLGPEVVEFLDDYAALPPGNPYLGTRGHQVTLVTRQKRPGGSIGGGTRWVVVKELEHAGVTSVCGARTVEITDHGVVIEQAGKTQTLPADTVLIAGGLQPDLALYEALRSAGVAPQVHAVGEPELASHAIHTIKAAFRVAMSI
jgi:2,4-dienoyl-CoA reductase (NADPH2)